MKNPDLKYLLSLSVTFALLLGLCQSLEGVDSTKPSGSRRGTDKFDTPFCKPCDLKNCPTDVTPERCLGTVVKDQCNCCPICETSILSAPPVQSATEATVSNVTDNACNEIRCPKKQICMLNIQGIPMCRCPSVFYCRRNPALEDPNPSKWRRKKKISEVCGTDDKTYKSRCYLRIAECTRGGKIKVKHRGPCMKSSPERGVTPTSLPGRPNPYSGVAKKPIKNIQGHQGVPTLSKKQRRKQRRQRKQKKKDKMARKKNRDNRQDNRDDRKRSKNKGVKKNRKRSRKWRQRRRARQLTRRMFA